MINNNQKTLIVIRGKPGSGKSTFRKKYFIDASVCSADFYFRNYDGEYVFDATKLHLAHKYCMDTFLRAIKNKSDTIVIDNTNIKKKDYKDYVKIAKENGYEVYQAVMTGNYQNVHGVPQEKVEQMKNNFQEDFDLPHWKEPGK